MNAAAGRTERRVAEKTSAGIAIAMARREPAAVMSKTGATIEEAKLSIPQHHPRRPMQIRILHLRHWAP